MNISPASNPNAAAGGAVGGAGLGTLIVWLLNKYLDAGISPEGAAAAAGGIATIVLLIGRDGLAGVWKTLLHGNPKKGY